MEAIKRRSGGWYILPILLGWVGGIIGYFAVRHDDPGLAKGVLILGIVLTVAWIAISFIIGIIVNIVPTTS